MKFKVEESQNPTINVLESEWYESDETDYSSWICFSNCILEFSTL